jgi:hypothetical protein
VILLGAVVVVVVIMLSMADRQAARNALRRWVAAERSTHEREGGMREKKTDENSNKRRILAGLLRQ